MGQVEDICCTYLNDLRYILLHSEEFKLQYLNTSQLLISNRTATLINLVVCLDDVNIQNIKQGEVRPEVGNS